MLHQLKASLNKELKSSFWITLLALLAVNKLLSIYYLGWVFNGKSFLLSGIPGTAKEISDGSIYEHASFLLASFNNLFLTIPVLLLTLYLFLFRKQNEWSYTNDDLQKPTKIFVLFVSSFLVWFFAFSQYNFFLDNFFGLERVTLLELFFLLCRYNWLLPAFLYLIVLCLAQFSYPLGLNSITEKKLSTKSSCSLFPIQ